MCQVLAEIVMAIARSWQISTVSTCGQVARQGVNIPTSKYCAALNIKSDATSSFLHPRSPLHTPRMRQVLAEIVIATVLADTWWHAKAERMFQLVARQGRAGVG